jgi:hypothetical protein
MVNTLHIDSQPIALMMALKDNLLHHTPLNIMVWLKSVIALYLTSFNVFSWVKDCFNSHGQKLFEH